jgi:eukaryotic-like serine/threonine-protein kinase
MDMSPDTWQRVKTLFRDALERPALERAPFLAAACAGDSRLRREVESLLAEHEEAGDFIARPAVESVPAPAPAPPAARRIGAYRIVREIGRGGMGTVYLAERDAGEFRQQAAVKLVRAGLETEDVIGRFRRERQILAGLEHPNVARLLDGGTTPEGLPYFVMEYIEGAPITEYCAARRLPVRERLELFRRVCSAVAYAHRHLIVHRDIKPSNILVTDEGVPKLLDFGLAKILDDALPDPARTATAFRAFTPAYAAPEQVRGDALSTACDVYSLGVVLYELLTGARPFDFERKSFGEIMRAADAAEPSRPSEAARRRAGASAAAADSTAPAAPRPLPGDAAELKGELDNITLMALRREPERRYRSVEQFSEDIGRYLEGLPVLAHKDSFGYRAAKFVRRNRAGAAAAALVLLALAGGVTATVRQSRRTAEQARIAARERDRARLEAAKAERINEFLQSVFASANPSWYSTGFGRRGEVKVVDVLEQAGRRIDTDFKEQPGIRAELHHTIGTTYQSLGRYETARVHFRAAVDAYRGLYGERHPEVAEALYYLAASMQNSGDFPGSLVHFRRALEIFREVDPDNVNVPYLLSDYSYILNLTGESAAAEQAAREGLELARRRFGDEHVLTTNLLTSLGTIYETRGDLSRAETFHRAALATFDRMPNGRMLSAGTQAQLSRLAMSRGDLTQAEAHAREALDIARQTFNETNPWNGHARLLLAEIHYRQGAYADAEKEARSALDLLRRVEVPGRDYELAGLSLMSMIHAKTNRPASADTLLGEALTLFNSLPDEIRHHDGGLLGEALVASKRDAEARALLPKRYEYLARKYGEQNPSAVRTRRQLDRLGGAARPELADDDRARRGRRAPAPD